MALASRVEDLQSALAGLCRHRGRLARSPHSGVLNIIRSSGWWPGWRICLIWTNLFLPEALDVSALKIVNLESNFP